MLAQATGFSVSWDFNTATLVAIGTHIVAVIVFMVRTNSRAQSAYDMADKAQKRADEAHTSLAAHQAAFNLFQVHVATEYVDRDALREMEGRIHEDIGLLTERIDKVLDSRKIPRG